MRGRTAWAALAVELLLLPVGLTVANAAQHRPTPVEHRVVAAPATGLPVAEVTPPALSDAELAAFRNAAGKSAASAPLKRLPTVDLSRVTVNGIPGVAYAAYRSAARRVGALDPGCRLPWWLLAGIGFVESGHAHSGGSSRPGWNGVAKPPIYGPMLDGSGGWPAFRDTDHGRLDGSPKWDRAVGPMQFIPSTWRSWAAPGRHDGRADPQDIRAAAFAAARYLCAGGSDLSAPRGLQLAVFSYNHSFDYVRLVLSVGARYGGIDVSTLGLDRLPTDKAVAKGKPAKKGKRGAAKKPGTQASTTTRSGAPASHPAASRSPGPSPSPSSAPAPVGPTPAPPPVTPPPLPSPGFH